MLPPSVETFLVDARGLLRSFATQEHQPEEKANARREGGRRFAADHPWNAEGEANGKGKFWDRRRTARKLSSKEEPAAEEDHFTMYKITRKRKLKISRSQKRC